MYEGKEQVLQLQTKELWNIYLLNSLILKLTWAVKLKMQWIQIIQKKINSTVVKIATLTST